MNSPLNWDRIIAVNLTGPFNVIWAVKPGMVAQEFGRIVNVSSIAALAVRPDQLPYGAAKAGVISLTEIVLWTAGAPPYPYQLGCAGGDRNGYAK